MQMVATARLRRARQAIEAARPYARQLDRVLGQVALSLEGGQHPLLRKREMCQRVAVVVVTTDRGLCGGFNANICRRAVAEMRERGEMAVELVTVGRKGRDFFRSRGYEIARHHADVFRHLEFNRAVEIAQVLTRSFLEGAVDQVLLVFSEFRSIAQQMPTVAQLLPIVPPEERMAEEPADYLFEPAPEVLLESLVSRHVNFQVWRALLESNAGEQAARMQAMDSATRNAGDLIEELTREINKERQTSITLELMDIIGGAAAVS
jgi:F-type H+-transporting ATPase subunit gamma